ncbi:MAG: Gfo/Idh/MocA family protein [Thermomicrobiales bacterium]
MLRLGIVNCDTSHVYQFARRLNHVGVGPEQWVEGAKVVAAYVGTSRITEPARIEEYVAAMIEAGVDLVERPEDLLGRVDAILIESNEGGIHLQRARPFIEAGLPVFVDKPLASTTADARTLVDLARRHGTPLISASALRFVAEVTTARVDPSLGTLVGADVHCPARLHKANPGLFHYGVHGVEMLYALLGPGCREVACAFEEGGEVVTGRWSDGRIGVVRGLRAGTLGYGLTVYGEQGIRATAIATEWIYRDLLKVVVPVLAGAPSPIGPDELIEVVAFQEAALVSARAGGKPTKLAT